MTPVYRLTKFQRPIRILTAKIYIFIRGLAVIRRLVTVITIYTRQAGAIQVVAVIKSRHLDVRQDVLCDREMLTLTPYWALPFVIHSSTRRENPNSDVGQITSGNAVNHPLEWWFFWRYKSMMEIRFRGEWFQNFSDLGYPTLTPHRRFAGPQQIHGNIPLVVQLALRFRKLAARWVQKHAWKAYFSKQVYL